MGLRSFTIYDVFKRNARCFRDRIALEYEGAQVTYEELFERINEAAGWFATKGIVNGDRIAVLAKNSPLFFILTGAIAAVGAIMVPINFRLSTDEIKYVLTDSEPFALFFEPDFENMIPELSACCSSLRELVILGPSRKDFTSFESLLKSGRGNPIALNEDDPFMIMYTAAIQGRPRGAVLSHRNLVAGSLQTISVVGLSSHDTYLAILPLFHIAGLVASFAVMHAGGKNVIVSKFDPKAAVRMVEEMKVSVVGDFPPILAQLLDEASGKESSLSSLRHVMGVEFPETVKRFERLGYGQFWLAYGQSETMGWTCLCANSERPGSAGRPGPLVDLRIVDEFDREVEMGKPGEIVIRGPVVFQGYWKQDELTSYTFREGWHHTGDMGRLDKEGYLFFAGRKSEKELIKTGGENVYPVEVEKVILEHPCVKEVSVIGVPDPKFGEGIKAVCVLRPSTQLTEQELIDFVAARIARYKKPAYVSFIDSLPKKEDGSIDREKVKALCG